MSIRTSTSSLAGGRSIHRRGNYVIQWGVTPANTVRVKARRGQRRRGGGRRQGSRAIRGRGRQRRLDADHRIGRLRRLARHCGGHRLFSGSMSFSSLFKWNAINELGQDAIEANLADAFTALELADTGTMDSHARAAGGLQPALGSGNRSRTSKSPSASTKSRSFPIRAYDQVKLDFADGTSESIATNEASGTYSGTGDQLRQEYRHRLGHLRPG